MDRVPPRPPRSRNEAQCHHGWEKKPERFSARNRENRGEGQHMIVKTGEILLRSREQGKSHQVLEARVVLRRISRSVILEDSASKENEERPGLKRNSSVSSGKSGAT